MFIFVGPLLLPLPFKPHLPIFLQAAYISSDTAPNLPHRCIHHLRRIRPRCRDSHPVHPRGHPTSSRAEHVRKPGLWLGE